MAQSIRERREQRRKRRQEEPTPVLEAPAEQKGITESKGRATPSRRDTEVEVRPNAVMRWVYSVRDYIVGVRSEVGKVTWPTREEAIRLTRIVSMVVVMAALVLGGLALIFTEMFSFGVNNPWVFVVVFVAFLVFLFAYGRYMQRTKSEYQR